jgi:hypothetical protein
MPSVDPVLMVQSRLTDRDWTLLGWLADHGVLTSDQIAHALFPSLDACQRRLQTRHRAGGVSCSQGRRVDRLPHPGSPPDAGHTPRRETADRYVDMSGRLSMPSTMELPTINSTERIQGTRGRQDSNLQPPVLETGALYR